MRDDDDDIHPKLTELTAGRGPDAAIDAVGMEVHGSVVDRTKQAMKLAQDRPHVLREAMRAVRTCGRLSVPGVYAGYLDKVPFGAAFGKGITITGGQTHMHRYMRPLLELVQKKKIDPSFVVTHRVPLIRQLTHASAQVVPARGLSLPSRRAKWHYMPRSGRNINCEKRERARFFE